MIGASLLATATAVLLSFQIEQSDFRMFYDAGIAWRTGGPLYSAAAPNLHPPAVAAWVFAPLSRMPFPLAQGIWFAASAAGLLLSLRLVARELDWSPRETTVAFALLSVTYASWIGWYQGQTTWLLAYPASRSWRAYRRGRLRAAGFWFAPLIVVKPTLALVALCLPWRIWVAAGLTSLSATVLGVLRTGPAPWIDWWSFRDHVFWIPWPDNASAWGLAVRFVTGDVNDGRLADVPAPVVGGVLAACAAAWWVVTREADADRRSALAWLTGVLAAPIGWVHYLPMGFAAFFSSWRPRARAAYAILCIPFMAIYPITSGTTAPWAGSIYFVGTLLAWWAWTPRHAVAGPRTREDLEARDDERGVYSSASEAAVTSTESCEE